LLLFCAVLRAKVFVQDLPIYESHGTGQFPFFIPTSEHSVWIDFPPIVYLSRAAWALPISHSVCPALSISLTPASIASLDFLFGFGVYPAVVTSAAIPAHDRSPAPIFCCGL
jgi:hypothetical protein